MTFRRQPLRISAPMSGALLASALFVAAPMVAVTCTPAQAQQVSVSGEFRTALEPHGRWERHPRWGEVWKPGKVGRDWRPYTVGRWVYSDEWGWYWVSDEQEADWGWATFHYGRWVSDREPGWAWIPGDEWGPGFVQWRRGSERVGWAPLPPDDIVVEYRDEPDVWVFCGARDFVSAPRLVSVILPPRQYDVYIRETVVVNRTVIVGDRGGFAVNPGIAPGIMASIAGRPVRSFDVRPRILAGTARIPGAIEIRAGDTRDRNFRREVTVRETKNVIQPARGRVPEPQPLAAGDQVDSATPRPAPPGGEMKTAGKDAMAGAGSSQRARRRSSVEAGRPARRARPPAEQREQRERGSRKGAAPDEQQRGRRDEQEGRRPERAASRRGKQEGRPPDEQQRGKQEGRRPDEQQRGKQEGRPPDEQQRGKQEGRPPDEQRQRGPARRAGPPAAGGARAR